MIRFPDGKERTKPELDAIKKKNREFEKYELCENFNSPKRRKIACQDSTSVNAAAVSESDSFSDRIPNDGWGGTGGTK